MNKKTIGLVSAIAASIACTIGALNVLVYLQDRGKCDQVPRGELEALDVKLPDGVTVCAGRGNASDVHEAEYRLNVASGPVCIVTGGVLGCTSTSDVGLSFLQTMTSASWGTGTLRSDEDSAT